MYVHSTNVLMFQYFFFYFKLILFPNDVKYLNQTNNDYIIFYISPMSERPFKVVNHSFTGIQTSAIRHLPHLVLSELTERYVTGYEICYHLGGQQ